MLIFHTMYNGLYIYNPGQNLLTQIEILSNFHCYDNVLFLASTVVQCCLILLRCDFREKKTLQITLN